jgi:ketosteroid isomerase-like protein
MYDSFGKGDIPAVLAQFDPEIEWVAAENLPHVEKSPFHGPQAILQNVFMHIPEDWNGFRVNVEKIIDAGDTVVMLGRYTATSKATGQPLNAQVAHVWTIRNGKAVKFQQYADTAQFQRVIGGK